MKRRTILLGGAGVALASGAGVFLSRPADNGKPHDDYFSGLNSLLRNDGPGRPVMLLDIERVNHNIDNISSMVGPNKTYRIVVKSLPSIPLLRHTMMRADTTALMLFHQPFLNEIANEIPEADVLLGKPMPVRAVRLFYNKLSKDSQFKPERQVQWLIDTPERLLQYQTLAKELGVQMRVNFELDVGLHRGGFEHPESIRPMLDIIKADPGHLAFAGYMGYEPQLTGMQASLSDPAVQQVLDTYRGFLAEASAAGYDPDLLTRNGAGSHTLGIYGEDTVLNDLSAGSGIVKPTDFDTYHLDQNLPALFIASPILKRYDELRIPGDPAIAKLLPLWNPNMQRIYYIYGGYWKARVVSPGGVPDPIYQSTNQSPYTTSNKVDLQVDDYVFFRPTQSEFVMLQFGDLVVVSDNQIVNTWPVFQQTG
jgi:D-serine deaminase-like pyridoxal phosphate-dependent protein